MARGIALLIAVLAWGAAPSMRADLVSPSLLWGPTVVGTNAGSAYYLNDNVVAGDVLGGHIGYGPYEQAANGTLVSSLATAPVASAKAAVRVGDYVYFTGDSGGVYRTQVGNTATPWSTFTNCAVGNGLALETITTDGTHIFGSTSAANDQVHAYSVDPATGALTLLWSTSNIVGRVRGIDWDASGYLYAADGGGPAENATNNTAHIYAIDAATGATTDMGTITFNGRQYQSIREGNQLVVFDSYTGGASGVPAGQMYVYNLTGDTALASTIPVSVWDPAGIDRIFGAAIDGNQMWLTSINGQTFGYAVPEPATIVLLCLGAVWLAMALGRGRGGGRELRG
ncbi:MAG TPA: PEP-CTERM sorting domain-containing protein [Verrucomicrobiae bacterium]|nr:PEP-CTERM sorting domain-containing protein [Verrucomicrobiae bacterium]